MADNPILNWSDTRVFEDERLPLSGSQGNWSKAAQGAIDTAQILTEDSLISDLQKADQISAEEIQAQQTADLQEVDDVLSKVGEQNDPQFASAVRELTRLAVAQRQGSLTATSVQLRREQVLRKYVSRHPQWASDLTDAANAALGGSTVGDQIKDASAGTTQSFNDIRDNGTKLGVDPALWTLDPAQASMQYLRATNRAYKIEDAQQTVQLALATGVYSKAYDAKVGDLVNEEIGSAIDLMQDALESPEAETEAARTALFDRIKQQMQARKAEAIYMVSRMSNGQLSEDQITQAIPQIGLYDTVIAMADSGIPISALKTYNEAEKEGWIASRPGAAVSLMQLDALAKIATINPEIVRRERNAVNRIGGAFLRLIESDLDNGHIGGPNLPDSVGEQPSPVVGSALNFELNKQVTAQADTQPGARDKLYYQRAVDYVNGQLPSKAEVRLMTNEIASDKYREQVAASAVTPEVRDQRAATMAQMLATEFFAPDANGGVSGNWMQYLSGIEWKNGKAAFIGQDLDQKTSDQLSPRITQLVKAIAHLHGSKDYAAAAATTWDILGVIGHGGN